MTSTHHKQLSDAIPLHYRLTNAEWLRAVRELKPRERDILYYLRTLDPFGDTELDIPIRDVARKIGCSPSTVSDALKALERKGWIDLQIASAKVKLKSSHSNDFSQSVRSSEHDRSSEQSESKRSLERSTDRSSDRDRSSEQLEMLHSQRLGEFSTENENVPEQTKQICFKEQTGSRTKSGVSTKKTREKTGTSLDAVSDLIPTMAGVALNSALSSVITSLWNQDPEIAETRVRNAISSYLEQREIVKNPQAFISSALSRGFTSNTAKKRKKVSTRTTGQRKQKQTKLNLPPSVTATDLSTAIALIDVHCKRLGISRQQGLQRFGIDKPLDVLTPLEIQTFHDAVARW